MKKPVFFLLQITLALCALTQQPAAQSHSVYLLSNLENLSPSDKRLDAFQKQLQQDNNAFTILINGDFLDKNGLSETPEQADLDKLDRLLLMVGDKGRILFIPGDREWGNGSKKGLKKVKALERYLEEKVGKGKILFPQKGCQGPEVIDINEQLRIVAINTQWFLNDHAARPEEEDADCGLLNETEFWLEVEDALSESENRNIIVAGHHPVLSYGQYAGYRLVKQHLLPPIAGSFIAAYHQNVGGEKDLNQARWNAYSNRMVHLTQRFSGGIFVSGHEYDTQLLYKNDTYHINSGAFAQSQPVARGRETLYKNKKPAFVKLLFSEDGAVQAQVLEWTDELQMEVVHQEALFTSPCAAFNPGVPRNLLFNPCEEVASNTSSSQPGNISATAGKNTTTAIAGQQYKAGFLKRMFLGRHYRSSWTQPVANIPYLNLDTTYGGLTPVAKGGGAQTISVELKAADGRSFAFRSVNKNPTQRMDKDLRPGVYGKITQDKTSHQHPYSSKILGPLMDSLGLPHSQPQLYVMPDDPRLGAFREEFAGMFGTLELKPKGKKKGKAGFRNADDVVSTMEVYQKMIDDNDHYVEAASFVKARLLDIWVADWDRHFNNYKWLAYEEGELTRYTVFPKDRDKSLSLYQGLYKFIEVFHLQKDKSHFRKHYYGMKYLNYKNKTMDRWFLNAYTYEDWMNAVSDFQKTMTDEAIAEAIHQLPPETQPLVRENITKVLQARRKRLPKAIHRYYKMLARQIDLIGSNSKELFDMQRLPNGDVQATIYAINKEGIIERKIYERLLKRGETKEIRLHGLGKDDIFRISGESKKGILIRVIGGKGEDRVEDTSKVRGFRKMTKVYDKRGTDTLQLNTEALQKDPRRILTFESDNFFNYNYLNLLPQLAYNSDDGLLMGITGSYTRQQFDKPDFGQQYNFSASFTTRKNYNLALHSRSRHLLGSWDGTLGFAMASRDKTFRQFYGLSNENDINDDLAAMDYYENESSSLNVSIGLLRSFWQRSSFTAELTYDAREVEVDDNTIYKTTEGLIGLGRTALVGPQLNLNLDMRDSPTFPTRGLQVQADVFHYLNSEFDYEKSGGRWSASLSSFHTAGVKMPVTLSLRGGYIQSYGKTPFYYKAFLGQVNNLRGYVRNQFGGDEAAYLNTDLRFHFGKVITPLVPVRYGIFGLFDTGRTWTDGLSSEQWHYAYGGGVYLIPYAEPFNLTLSGAWDEAKDFRMEFRVGFFVR